MRNRIETMGHIEHSTTFHPRVGQMQPGGIITDGLTSEIVRFQHKRPDVGDLGRRTTRRRGLMTIADFRTVKEDTVVGRDGEPVFENTRKHWIPHFRELMTLVANHEVSALEAADILSVMYAGKAAESIFDAKLKVYNVAGLEMRAREMLANAHRYKRPVTFGLIDLDHFKNVNDTYGHLMGDDVLRAVTAHWKGNMRPEDVFARFGGEEFAVLLNLSPDVALPIIERIRKSMPVAVEDALGKKGQSLENPVTASIGVAALPTPEGKFSKLTFSREYRDLLTGADAALYYAKTTGRDNQAFVADLTPSQLREAMLYSRRNSNKTQ